MVVPSGMTVVAGSANGIYTVSLKNVPTNWQAVVSTSTSGLTLIILGNSMSSEHTFKNDMHI